MKAKKHLGQNFLQDRNIIEKIISLLDKQLPVIEIGPGTGALTRYLNEFSQEVTAYEVDERSVDLIRQNFSHVDVQHRDFLTTEAADFELSSPIQVIGNIPYYITSPILFHIFENRRFIKKAVITMQYEVARRIVASKGCKDYGIMSVQAQLFSDVKLEFQVPRTVFHPRPNVDSAVVSFLFNKVLEVEDDKLKQIVRTAFNQRRKMISNSLKAFNLDRVPAETLKKRPDALTPMEFVELTKLILVDSNSK